MTVGHRRAGLLTSELERLEKIDPTQVERTGASAVVQYRGRLLPLVYLDERLGCSSERDNDRPLRVVVTSERASTSVGLVVDQVLDVVEIDPALTDRVGIDGRSGVIGSAVAAGSVIELLDIPAIIADVDAGPLSPVPQPQPRDLPVAVAAA